MRGIKGSLTGAAVCAGLYLTVSASAQTVADNATLQSSDAFGRSVGNEKTGLYNSDEVRGFNPIEAGNARIEGLYIDLVDRFPGRLRPTETVRVGLSSQRYPFPAPTGLIDFELVDVGDHFIGHAQAGVASFGSPDGRLQFKVPLDGGKIGIFAGAGYRAINRAEGEKSQVYNYSVLLAFHPYDDARIALFAGKSGTLGDEARPTIYQSGRVNPQAAAALPAHMPRRRFLGQPWAVRDLGTPVYGGIAKLPFGDWRFEAGLFFMRRDFQHFYADILTDVDDKGNVGFRSVIADAGNVDQSLSGDLRLVREWSAGALRHTLTASLRGRHKQRLFGNYATIALGPSSAVTEDFRPAPNFTVGRKNHDDVRQLTWGLAYNLFWTGRANVDVSLAKTHYTKRVDFSDPSLADTDTRDSPILWNIDASVALTRRLTIYAGVSHGQEEALVAPDNARNKDVAPPAIHTRQVEAGLRYAITTHLGLVAGVFSITKPYYNLDSTGLFRLLGNVRNRGIEVSLTGQVGPGINVVAGSLFLDPSISGPDVSSGIIGARPVGQIRRHSVVNLDWRLRGGKSPVSVDLAIDSFSGRMANSSNSLSSPGFTTVNLGARYRFELGQAKFLLRVQVQNLFDTYGWNVSSSGGFTYNSSRSFEASLFVDF